MRRRGKEEKAKKMKKGALERRVWEGDLKRNRGKKMKRGKEGKRKGKVKMKGVR